VPARSGIAHAVKMADCSRVWEHMRLGRGITRSSVIAGALLLGLAATGQASTVALQPAAGVAGSTITLHGSGFPVAKRVTVTANGVRRKRVRTSRHGTFVARLVVPAHSRGLRVVSRRGRRRVVNRFRVTRVPGANVVEVASSRGPRVRVSPTRVVAGARVSVNGHGYRRRIRLRISAFGSTRHVRTGRTGRLRSKLAVPRALRPGVRRVRVIGGRARFSVRVRVSRPAPPRPAPAKPSNASSPQIAGVAQAGRTLTAGVGIWVGTAPIEYAFVWQRCAASCTPIHAATGPHYTAVDRDRGYRLRVVVTASNGLGATAAASPLTAVVTAMPGVSRSPTLPAMVQEGHTVRVTSATFTGPAPDKLTTQWLRCADTCVRVGAGKTSYVPVAADVGFRLQVVQTASRAGGTIQVASNKTDPVRPAATATGVVAQWSMNDTGSTMTDSARNHDGTLHGVATRLPGYLGTAFGFNGATSYITVPRANDLSAIDHNVTLTMRMRTGHLPPATVQDWDLIRSAGGYYDGDEYKMEYAPNGTAHCAFKGSGSTGYKEVASSPAKPLNDGAWHTIKCVKTTTQVQTVVDGTVYSARATIGTITITRGMILGAHPNSAGNGSSEFYNGSLDEGALAFSAASG
jgi:Concanavalin A-like lectin/glucanases superfamily